MMIMGLNWISGSTGGTDSMYEKENVIILQYSELFLYIYGCKGD